MQALDGLLVVAIEQAVAAPLCTSRLAAAGARVIKIERPEGDFARGYDTVAQGESSYFTWLNQGKESACIDFKTKGHAHLLTRILDKADILVQNLSPGALQRAGISIEAVRQRNSKLIVCNISGYGEVGEISRRPAYDLLVQAESGLISVSGSPGAPGRIGVSLCDIGAGVTAYSGVLEALIQRGITGQGDEFSVSLFDVAADWMAVPFMHAEYGDGPPPPVGLRHPSIAPYGAYACADGKQVLISIQNEREWHRLCRDVLKQPDLAGQCDFATNNDRVANLASLDAQITAVTMTITSLEFQSRLSSANIAFGAVNSSAELIEHPAFRAQTIENSSGEKLILPAAPINWATPANNRARAPKVGEHNQKILQEFGVETHE